MTGTTVTKRRGLFERWAAIAYRRRWLVLAAWVVGLIAITVLGTLYGGEFSTEFRLPGSETQRAADLLEDRFPARSGDSTSIVIEAPAGIEDPAVQARVEQLMADVDALPGIAAVSSPYDDAAFIADDGTFARAEVYWTDRADEIDHALIHDYLDVIDAANGDGLTVETGGDVVQMVEFPEFSSELFGLSAAIIILLVAFGSVVAAGVPIGAAVFGLGVGFALISLLARFIPFPDFAPQFAAMIGIGVGIDYALLVVTRFREGLHAGRTVEDSIVLAVGTAGRSVLFAGLVVAIAFLGLFAMGIPFIAAMGTTGAIVVTMAVLVALTLTPALLSIAGTRVDSWRVPFLHSTEGVDVNSGWYRFSKAIQRRPLPYFLGSAVFLLVLAIPVLDIELGFTDAGNNPEEFHSRRAYDLLSRGFGDGYNGPFLLVADLSRGGQDAVDSAVEAVRTTPGVVFVGEPQFNEAGDTAIIVAVPSTAPQDAATTDVVHDIRNDVIPAALAGSNADIWLSGATAAQIDVGDRIRERMPLLFTGVIGLSFLLLVVVFRSIVIAIKAAIMNLLSIGASFGVLIAVFQWGWFADLIGVGPGPIEVFLPMMLFCILFGLSMDYEVFLISRVREEYLKTGHNATAVSNGLAATARVITAAAAIMISVFLSFVLGDDRIIKEFGLGLATAIFIDATIVRLILVPATMELLGERNWWMPAWLDRLVPHLNVEGDGAPDMVVPPPAVGPAGGGGQ